jgi:UDP-N-acetyl-2-amino-2-deoxyglucuronate dehydrogenase
MRDTKNFAVTGVAGYVAPRHLQAIRDCRHTVVAAVDPSDSVGILDQYGFDIRFFTEFDRFERHLDHQRALGDEHRVHYVSVCSPNDLHDRHCRAALRGGADVICEKPLVVDPCGLDALEEAEAATGGRIWTVLQLRLHPTLIALRERLGRDPRSRFDVSITYVTARGQWYDVSWKGTPQRSGGVVTNIGIHLFDLMLWLFGPAIESRVHLASARRMAGFLELERARVRWFLSVEPADLPDDAAARGINRHHSIVVDGEEIEFTAGLLDPHTRVYERTLAGEGFGIADARGSIELSHAIRNAGVTPAEGSIAHPLVRRTSEAVWFA